MGIDIPFGQAIGDLWFDITLARSIRIALLLTFRMQEIVVRTSYLNFQAKVEAGLISYRSSLPRTLLYRTKFS